MHLVLSGEGKTDLGTLSFGKAEFIPAPMYFIIDKLIEKKYDYSFFELTPQLITYIPEAKLVAECKSFKSFSGKKSKKETGLFYKNAKGLARIAKAKIKELDDKDVIVVFFRDSDGTNSSPSTLWKDKVESIENGFNAEHITNGVAMVPKPKSEAWLICPLKSNSYQNCKDLEKRSGNDTSPNSLKDVELKKILEEKGIEYSDINELIKSEKIDLDKIDMESFNYFKEKINSLL